MNTRFKPTLIASALALAVGPAAAMDVYLAAKPFTKSLPMAGGALVDVPMWGYVVDTGDGTNAHCYDITTTAADRAACVAALPDPAVPGPPIAVPATDTALRIYLTNGLPEPTSVLIPGQDLPYSATDNGPTWDDGATGARTSLTQKVRSFGREANADGGRRAYIWNNFRGNPFDRPGSFVYHSGTQPQKQVYMGLYGAVVKNAVDADDVAGTPAVAYNDPADGVTPLASTTYDNEVVLFYSDVDPDINNAIDNGSYITSVEMNARWFLVNGEPYDPDNKADPTMTIPAGAANTPTLVRFFSAASETHVPTLQGLYMSIHAEDGLVYKYQDDTGGHAAPRTQYSAKLPPLKTKDAIIVPKLAGTYAVYDGNGYMTNPSNIDDFNQGDTVGGMLRFLAVGAGDNLAPIVVDDAVEVVEGRTVTIDVLANDTDPNADALTITNVDTTGTVGTLACDTVNPGGICDYTADGALGVTTFTYGATDGLLTNDPPDATVTITVVANAVPVANADSATTDASTPVVVNVLANDTDGNNDSLTIASVDTTGTAGTVTCDNALGDCTYTPDGVFTGDDTFTYVATDGTASSASATVTVTVNPVAGAEPPVAVNDAYSIGEDTLLNVAVPGVLANDTDANGDALTVSQVNGSISNVGIATATTHGTVTVNADGSFSYLAASNYNGPDSFTYVANDGTADSNVATVSIDVTPVNDAPVAVSDTFYLTSMYAPGQLTTVPATGVLANDTDLEGDNLTALPDPAVEPPPVDPPAELVLNGDGSFTYTTGDIGNLTLGTVDTFTYVAEDDGTPPATSTSPGTVTLVRKLTVSQAVCEWEPQQGGRCDWVIQGSKLDAATQIVVARYNGTLIGATTAGAGAWTITRNNFTGVRPPIGTSIDIDVTVVNDPDAAILAYPTVSQ